ncbi:uncharacterized protein LOC133316450 [Gastrolobium bilobum]|uniref:uncharacterized protein LOC133316450 n=1 Tax=Gastrolobium bilobum TaxID=150636 RepID=UPI002AB0D4DA|nr:uncharacterized protein LOC133316450 [Gastrolobium bilobum]
MVPWSEEKQPVSDAAALLNGFLGHLACNTNMFPICFDRWPHVPPNYKKIAWEKTITKKFNVFLDYHHDYCMGSMGKKWKDNRWRLCNYYYHKDRSYEQNLENYPDGLTREQWAGFLQYKLSDKAKKYSEINTRNRAKQTIMHTLGSKSIARTKYDLEQKHGRKFSRGEMWAISHTKKDGNILCEEAREKNDELQAEIEEITSEDEAFETVLGKEHPGRVRGKGYGVVITQMRKRRCTSASSSSAGPSQAEYDALKQELDCLKGKIGEFDSMKAQMASIMQHLNAQQASHISLNEVADMGSPGVRRSSHASYDPNNEGPDPPHQIPPPPPPPQS